MDWDDAPVPARHNPLLAVVGLLVIVALLVGVTVIAFDKTDKPRGVPAGLGSSKPTVSTKPPTKSELDRVVADISAFVAKTRELDFKKLVEVTLLDGEAFSARVKADSVKDLKELEETESVLHALGLLPDDTDLAQILGGFLGDTVVGFYDPETDELVVRGAGITPYVRTTLAHELTHALDDQWFELHRELNEDDESGTAFSALTEGNAVRVDTAYRKTLTGEEQKEADAEEARLGAGLDLSKIPRVIPELIGFPYAFGPAFVDALLEQGGEKNVDRAFNRPPVTSEQVLDPQGWYAGAAADNPKHVAAPKADGKVIDQGNLGLWGIYVLLEDELGQQDAIEAAKGWGGDWYVAWTDGPKTCVRSTFVMDTPKDLKQLGDGLDDWAAAQDDATVQRAEGSVTFLSCD